MPINDLELQRIADALAAPFDPAEVKYKPAVVSGGRALAMFYIDARAVQDRLDDALGVWGWSDEYEVLADGSVVCKLRCRFGDEWLTKSDVGGMSEQPDGGDRTKAAFSDALKRAAVKFGIGRYLYRIPASWWDFDPQKKKFTATPKLPDWAIPKDPRLTITRDDGKDIDALVGKHGASYPMIFEHYRIERLGQLPYEHLADCKQRIKEGKFTPKKEAPAA